MEAGDDPNSSDATGSHTGVRQCWQALLSMEENSPAVQVPELTCSQGRAELTRPLWPNISRFKG